MALFNVQDLFDDKPEPIEIPITGFKDEETHIPYEFVITVQVSRKIVEATKAVYDKAVTVERYLETKGKNRNRVKITADVDHGIYVSGVLKIGFLSGRGEVLDEYTVESLIALCERFPDFQEELSNKLLKVYQGQNKYTKEEAEDEKN